MHDCQEMWWKQVQSDMAALDILRQHGTDPCHQLHYWQMATEKLGKAYFCKPGHPPLRTHATLVFFLRSLGSVQKDRRSQIASLLRFVSFSGFQSWINAALPLAYELERLAPALAQGGPNTEYPWPQDVPVDYPARYQFPIWSQLTKTGSGRQFTQTIRRLVGQFPEYT